MKDYKKFIIERTRSFFNNIKVGLFNYIYIIDTEDLKHNRVELFSDINQNNTFALSEILSFNNVAWKDYIFNEEGEDFIEQTKNSICKESIIIFSNVENNTCYRLCLFLDLTVYHTVSNIDFLESLIESFLIFYSKEIQYGDEWSDEESATQTIYTEAASNYLSDIIFSLYGEHNKLFYRNLLSLSTQKYESSETKGKIIVGIDQFKSNLLFEEKIVISENLRMARKAVQLTNENTFLICDSKCFTGIHYKTRSKYSDSYFIEFTGYNSFKVFHGLTSAILEVNSGIPNFPRDVNEDYIRLENVIKEVNSSISNKQIQFLIKHIKSIAEYQKHGAVIAILENAKKEAKRLANISIAIKDAQNVNINSRNKYKTFGEIDGAILMDFSAHCYSFGVILDGKHLENEKPKKERGSRFNSSLRYIEQNIKERKCKKSLVIVMSEDGGFDILK